MHQAALRDPDIDDDYVLWLEHQVMLMRERQFAQLDIENLFDDLEYSVKWRKRARLRFCSRTPVCNNSHCQQPPFRAIIAGFPFPHSS